MIRHDFETARSPSCDLIASPYGLPPRPSPSEKRRSDDPLSMYLTDIFTVPANLAGLPGLSLACGFDDNGLPIGLQILAPAFAEAEALRAADAYQRDTDFHTRRPALSQGDSSR